jgi:hypothetical protein
VQLRISVRCPVGQVQGCNGSPLDVRVTSPASMGRYNGTDNVNDCGIAQGDSTKGSGNMYSSLHWVCSPLGLNLAAGESHQVVLQLVVGPSEVASTAIQATWGALSASGNFTVPRAQIHPLIVIPGILGTMPPWAGTGEFDPVLGVYSPMMKQLQDIGYVEGSTLFRLPYDWRRSNRVTARHLRDRIREALAASAGFPGSDQRGQQVDLLVHSMGGLVTRTYVEGEGKEDSGAPVAYNNDVRKVVFVATPHRGFPEDYKTLESGSWSDFLYNDPIALQAMDRVFWPAFVYKHWRETHPFSIPPMDCGLSLRGPSCVLNEYAMTHDAIGGIESLREMLPTPDSDAYFGPYLCEQSDGVNCTGPYPYGQPLNPLLPVLNDPAHLTLLKQNLDPQNLYVLYGVEPNIGNPFPSSDNNTDAIFDVKAPPAHTSLGMDGWANGEPELPYRKTAGDDLIPEYSTNLSLGLVPEITADHVVKLKGETARHKQIMYSPDVQSIYVPRFLAGMSRVPFYAPYSKPWFLIDPHQWWVLAGLCPVNVTITDAAGRRMGFDPATGKAVNDFAGMYASANSENQMMILKDPAPGTYTVTVTPFGEGPLRLALHQLTAEGSPRRALIEGIAHVGQTQQFTVVIDPHAPITQGNPTADAGPDQVVSTDSSCRAPVQLDGSRSSDPDGEALDYHWSGPFGYATGMRPTVTLPAGNHEITLFALDGQRGGSTAKTHVKVVPPPGQFRSLTATPAYLEPADGTMRSVSVVADVTASCGIAARCKIVDVDTDEGGKRDWHIVAPLKVMLRADRSVAGNGRVYRVEVECSYGPGSVIRKSVNVKVPPPRRMSGSGKVRNVNFEFDVRENDAGKDSGSVRIDRMRGDGDGERDDGQGIAGRFVSRQLSVVRFGDDADIKPGGKAVVDTVFVQGAGTWNGKSGYTFEMRAVDAGEPGAHRDRFRIVIQDAKGNVVTRVSDEIDSGNIQAFKPSH